jgi:hypothetical protein
MDIKAIKVAIAGCLGTMDALDPLTGLPYEDYYTGYPTGQKVRADTQAPFSISETDLPTWIIFTGPAQYSDPPDRTVDRLSKETRDFAANLYVSVAQSGIDGEAERKCEPYIEVSRKLFMEHPLFYDNNIADVVPGILRAYPIKDDGIVQLRYGNDSIIYAGIRFTIRVSALNQNNFGNE